MTTDITEAETSESQQLGISQLKRKSLGSSPSPHNDRHVDVPNKRPKVDDIPGHNTELEVLDKENGITANKTGDAIERDKPSEGMVADSESLSPDTGRPTAVVTTPPSSRQERRPSESRGRDTSLGRSPKQARRTYDSGTREASPASREQRRSEISRESSGHIQAHGDTDRNRRPAASKEEERKRGKRLFGGLISTLSQSTNNSQQKRRREIEKRQQEKAAKQKVEDDLRRNERFAKLEKIRKNEQVRFDEQVMRTRHSNMLATARGLQTRSEPKLYYRPWELTKEQEHTIKDQIRDAEVQIVEELQQFKRDKARRLRELGALSSSSEADAVIGEPAEGDRSSNSAQAESVATATNDRKRSPVPAIAPEDKDHDEMVEAEEDTVIY